MKLVDAQTLRDLVAPADLIGAMRDAFVDVSAGRARTTFGLLDLDDGDVHVKSAHVQGADCYVVKVASAIPSNAARGLPIGGGGVLLVSATTGAPLALLQDDHHLTDVRTAAAGALATDLMAAENASTVAVLGSGTQARLQVTALASQRAISRVHVWARRPAAAAELARQLGEALDGLPVQVVATPREAAAAADIVLTATASTAPLIDGAWLRPGQHLTAIGADDDRKRELAPSCFARADRIVVDGRAQTCAAAELAEAIAGGSVLRADIAELGEVLTGARDGRTTSDEITIAKLSGLGVQDLAAATLALDRLGIAA